MTKRFVSIWFPYLETDWFIIQRPALKPLPLVVVAADKGRMVTRAVNRSAAQQGIFRGMVLADARALLPSLQVIQEQQGLQEKLLTRIARWCIRFTPMTGIDTTGTGLILDASGCAHLWGGETAYLTDIKNRLSGFGLTARTGMADTIGTAWAMARYSRNGTPVENKGQALALRTLPPQALRLESATIERLEQLGLYSIGDFMGMPRPALRRRFGSSLLSRLDKALGHEEEHIEPVEPVILYQERLPCLEPIVSATGIEIALRRLLETICLRLAQEQKGIRTAVFKGFRVDGKIEMIRVGTTRPTHQVDHIFKLFEFKIAGIEPATGIELFILEAPVVEDILPVQEKLFNQAGQLDNTALGELLDRLTAKLGESLVQRFEPAEHYWPERSVKRSVTWDEISLHAWKLERPRPLQLLSPPERIEVTAPIPDYPPMLFRYQGKIHKILKADGPERIEQEWWLSQGQHRDYYVVEDEEGYRYWLFRSGHYTDKNFQWFIHGYFA